MNKALNLLKKPQVWGFFLSMAVIAIISLAFFYPDNIEGNTLMQMDMQQGEANGHEGVEYYKATGEKALWTNSLFSGMPSFQISPSYPSNSLFTWLNTVFSLGLPSPSDLLFMMMLGGLIFFYCLQMRWYYALLGAIAWGFSSYFVIIIGAGHIWKFMALTYIPPTIGGLVLCYRGRYWLGGALTALFAMLQLNANHPQMTYYFAFVMLAFAVAYLVESLRKKELGQWLRASAAVVVAGAFAIGANLPSLYNTYEYSKETKRSQSELTVADATAGGAESGERATGGLPKSEIVNWSYGKAETFSLLIPNIRGGANAKPQQGKMVYMGLDRLDNVKEVPYDIQPLLPYFPQYFNEGEGTNGPVYVGAIICALFLLGCIVVRGPMKWALLVLTVVSILLAWGRNFEGLTDLMIYNFPLYNKFRAVESILVIAEFTIPVLAIMALAQILRDTRRVYYGVEINWVFGCLVVVCAIIAAFPGIFGSPITTADQDMVARIQNAYPEAGISAQRVYESLSQLRLAMVSSDALRSIWLLALAWIALTLCTRRKLQADWGVGIIGVLVLVDLYGVDKRYVDHESFVQSPSIGSSYNPFQPDQIDIAIANDGGNEYYRVMDIPGFSSATRSYHHHMIGGYHAAKLNRYEDLINNRMAYVQGVGYRPELREDSIAALFPADQQEMIQELRADYRVLDMLNARYIITGDKDEPVVINHSALGNAWLVAKVDYVDGARAEMDALATLDPAISAVADRKYAEALGQETHQISKDDYIRLTSYSPNTLKYEVDSKDGGIAVFSEVYFPWGWKAEIDGQKTALGRVNYVLRAMQVPAGKHQIEMSFDPDSLHVTGTLAYICVTLIYLWLIGAAWLYFGRKDEMA